MRRLLPLVFTAFVASATAAPATPIPDAAKLRLSSANVVVLDAEQGRAVYSKAADEVTPIASLTKLMTAMVVLDAGQPRDELLEIDMDDFDYIKGSRSRLGMGAALTRDEMLRLALMSSENRAASTLARHYPGGMLAFVAAMNDKARSLGMTRTHYDDATGLSPRNVSTANDLAKLVRAASEYPLIREYSTTPAHHVEVQPTGETLGFRNSNALVKDAEWDIQLQKTGYIREAGRCVVMLATIASRPVVIVLLDSIGKLTRVADAQRVKYWLETGESLPASAFKRAVQKVKQKVTPKRKPEGKSRGVQGKFAATTAGRG
ncbi:MAG: D-alanyl-D-alanine endopeptidase [Burkholderiales bacterium]|nr:D-alanyl-D-alanine endopeptidase [Burkholderiales bacterium]